MMNRPSNFVSVNKYVIGAALLIFFIALVPRVTDLGTFLTADEKNWIGRSYEFIRAFKDFRFNEMLQTTHPGVTTLWVAGTAVTAKMLSSHIPFSFQNLKYFIVAAQLPVAVINAVLVALIYLLLRETLEQKWLALVGAVLIALDPFIVGYSRVVHVDAMLTGFLFAAALAVLAYAKNGFSRRWLYISAVLSSMAILTKAPAIFMIPFFWLVVIIYGRHRVRDKRFLIDRSREFVLWILIVAALFVLLWPAILWVPNPEGNVLVLKRDIVRAAITPHHMAESYHLNGMFYIFTLITRATPVVLGLVLIAAGWLVLEVINLKFKIFREFKAADERLQNVRVVWLLAAYVFFFVLMMVLGAKKGDRYILPVFPALDVLAVFGIWLISYLVSRTLRSVGGRYRGNVKYISVILSVLVALYLGITVFVYHPYNIAYSSPLFPDNLSQELGWGEGLEKVGQWLNKNAPGSVVASWYPEELGAYTSARVTHINAHRQGKVRYIVLYHNMFGRAPDHYANDFIDEYYKKREPVHVVKIMGKEYAWVYEKKVYERVIGEMLPGREVKQKVRSEYKGLTGFDLNIATYSGKAKSGELIVMARDGSGGLIGRWLKPIEDIEDNDWVEFKFDKPRRELKSLEVEIRAEGTREGDAPTIRYTSDFNYRDSKMVIDGMEKKGDLAVRLRYDRGGQVITEEDSKLLERL